MTDNSPAETSRAEKSSDETSPAEKSLAEQQAELVATLVAGGPVPDGVDPSRVVAAREALLRKRSAEVAVHWPQLAAAFGSRWAAEFAGWARDRPPAGAGADGLAFAASLQAEDRLPETAREEFRRAVSGGRWSVTAGRRRPRWRRARR